MLNLSLSLRWPFIRRHSCPTFDPALVVIPDGRLGVINHLKSDGNLGIRPITPGGAFLPNPSAHWLQEDKIRIPEELALHPSVLRPLTRSEHPEAFSHLAP